MIFCLSRNASENLSFFIEGVSNVRFGLYSVYQLNSINNARISNWPSASRTHILRIPYYLNDLENNFSVTINSPFKIKESLTTLFGIEPPRRH